MLAAVVVVVSILSLVTVRRSFPHVSGEVRLDGLTASVLAARDGKGIPHVYADAAEDLFFAQGYVHAQDRFFEMDFRRHVTAGRLAELVGDAALDTDVFVRTLGWRRVAEQEVALVSDESRALLDAYSRGVNAYVDGKSGSALSLEYALLSLTGPDYRPEPWTAVDSVAWVKAMAWDLSSNMKDEVGRVLAANGLSDEQVDELWPAYPDEHATIVGDDADGARGADPVSRPVAVDPSTVASMRSAAEAAAAVPVLLGTGEGIGSNSWVVDGSRTATGAPMLANDPHLAPSMPGIWYQVGLHCRQVSEQCPYDVSGFSFSGMPGVVVGHNARVAWGVTTMYADVADLHLERLDGDSYEYDGAQRPVMTRTETFEVAGGRTRTTTVRSTLHGPIVSDVDRQLADVGEQASVGGRRDGYAVSLGWTALTPQPTIEAVFALDAMQDWDDFRAAAEKFTVPSQNLVYADVDGNIGYQAPGLIPVRGRGDGRWPVPGWDSAYDWTGMIPFADLPSVRNPRSGVIVTANNRVAGDSYPYQLGADTAAGYRSQRILELLSTEGRLAVDDMVRMQMDVHDPNAERLVPALLDVDLGSAYYRGGQDLLAHWDLQADVDSAPAAYFNAVWRQLLALAFHDQLPESLWPGGGERWFRVVDSILDDPTSPWWDDVTTPGRVETRDEVLAEAMRRARDELTMAISRDPDDWSWGRLHRLELVNQTLGDSGTGVVEWLFNRGPFEVGGGGGLVDATGWDATQGYEVTAVPSMRMVVDLGDFDESRWIQLTGSSGHAFHEHYADQTPLWAAGETLPWAFSPEAVGEATIDALTLTPAGSS